MPHPARVPQKAARHRDEVRVTGRNDLLRLRRRGDQARRPSCVRRSRGGFRATKALGTQARVESFAQAKRRRSTHRSNRNRAQPAGPRMRSTPRASSRRRPNRCTKGARRADDPRAIRRERRRTLRAGSAMRCSKRAAVPVGAAIGDRRQEFVQQVAVRHVQLQCVDACAAGAARARHERVSNPRQFLGIERDRRGLMLRRAQSPKAQPVSSRPRLSG